MSFLLYFLALAPSLIWLLFYLRKDSHPESNRMIILTFFFGILSAILALIFELAFRDIITIVKRSDVNIALKNISEVFFNQTSVFTYLLIIFIGGALIEEFVKYLAVRLWVVGNIELDEPVDVMLYMVIAALGFAALENLFYLMSLHPFLDGSNAISNALQAMAWRFVSATFLHALCSGIFGYFVALSFCYIKKSKRYFFAGLLISFLLHGAYNWYIILHRDAGLKNMVPVFIFLFVLSIFVGLAFRNLKKLKSTCIILKSEARPVKN